MNLLRDIITYVRRIVKSPSDADLSDNLIIDYINRFLIHDVNARLELFDLKTTYQFQTRPGFDKYNMPLYDLVDVSPDDPDNNDFDVSFYPVYQGFMDPIYINGVQAAFNTRQDNFYLNRQYVMQNQVQVATGDGTSGPYTINLPVQPNATDTVNPPFNGIIRGHVDISGVISRNVNTDPILLDVPDVDVPVTSTHAAVYITSTDENNNNVVVSDSGQFLASDSHYGLLINPGKAPRGNTILTGDYTTSLNTVNYVTGVAKLNFPVSIPTGRSINAQCFFFTSGLPRSVLFYNNTITLDHPPDRQYLVEMTAYLTPTAFLNSTQAIPFAYMSEYIARGAARKFLSDTKDEEQFNFYEPFFREQELLVLKRSDRQFTATRRQNIYSNGHNYNYGNYGNYNI